MNTTRRDFIRKAAYVTPAVMTMAAVPALASSGSAREELIETAFQQQPKSWQSRARRNRLRRLEQQGIEVQRFSNWENIDPRLL